MAKKLGGSTTITIPKGFPGYVEKGASLDNGGKKKIEFSYDAVESDSEATEWIGKQTVTEGEGDNKTKRPKTLTDLVNEVIEARAKANAYQTANAAYKTSDLTEEEQLNKLVRDFMVFGKMSETQARNLAESTLANAKSAGA